MKLYMGTGRRYQWSNFSLDIPNIITLSCTVYSAMGPGPEAFEVISIDKVIGKARNLANVFP